MSLEALCAQWMQRALQRGYIRPDLQQRLSVQALIQVATQQGWAPQMLWSAVIGVLSQSPEQQAQLFALVREMSVAVGTDEVRVRSRVERWRAQVRAAWVGTRRWRWGHKRKLLWLAVLATVLLGERHLQERPTPPPRQSLCLPQVQAEEKSLPNSAYRRFRLPPAAPAPQPVETPLRILDRSALIQRKPVGAVLVAFVLALLGMGLLWAGPFFRRRARRARAALAAQAQTDQARDAKAQAAYAQLEEEAYEAGLHLRPDYRLELAPPIPANVIEDTATLLGRIYQAQGGRVLDVEATLAATLKAGGQVQPVMQPGRRVAELLVLVDEWDTTPYLPSFLKLLAQWRHWAWG